MKIGLIFQSINLLTSILNITKLAEKSRKMASFFQKNALILLLSTVSTRTVKAALNSSIYTQELQANHKQQTLPPSPPRSGHTSILCVYNLAYHTILIFKFSQRIDRCARNGSHICQCVAFLQQGYLTVIMCSVVLFTLSISLLTTNTPA